ncbi:hypothetical protein D9M70_613370 [compost metagenome]
MVVRVGVDLTDLKRFRFVIRFRFLNSDTSSVARVELSLAKSEESKSSTRLDTQIKDSSVCEGRSFGITGGQC